MSARETALNVLIACRREEAWANGVLKEYIRHDGLDRREAALAARLCYGVLQNRARLDFYLKQLLTGKLKNLHPVVHDILLIGLYQIYEMDKIPDSAAVNESVNLAKKYCRKLPNASGLVNGVLRNALRTKGTLKEPATLEERYSHPKKLIALLRSYVGQEKLEAMLKTNNEATSMTVQVNTLRTTAQELTAILEQTGISVQPHKWLPDCLVVAGTGDLQQLAAFQKGLFYVQDGAARLSVLCAQPKEGNTILDCCAAPGGKSFAAAIYMKNTGSIISCDMYAHKVALIQNGADRLGLNTITAMQQDATVQCSDWIGKMDVVIADVPCSGYGIIRKKPDIRYKDPDTMTQLPELQLSILRQQASYVKPGGVLLYSTCTLVRAENEGVVEAFLQENSEFTVEPLPLPAVFPKNLSGMLALIPGEYDTDGFFICRLRRKV